jgi:hypothetical protein
VGRGNLPVDELFTGIHCYVVRAGPNEWTKQAAVRMRVLYS